jgi:DNA-binding NtrC family response regulator
MQELVARLQAFTDCDLPIVLVGATGTGKSLLARWVHDRSGRRGAFVDCPCGALEPNLAESCLFGHVKGGFTGAVADRPGKLAQADGGTLLLDEFHLLERPVQYQLVGVMGSGCYEPVGSSRVFAVGCRFVIGIGEHPDVLVEAGQMLPDLRWRLGCIVLRVPTLAERREEIEPLARAFLERYADRRTNGGPRRLTRSAVRLLEAVEWPGNVRHLQSVVQAAYEVARYTGANTIGVEHLAVLGPRPPRYAECRTYEERLAAVAWALDRTGGRIREAAKLIDASRNTVSQRRRELGGVATCWGPLRRTRTEANTENTRAK